DFENMPMMPAAMNSNAISAREKNVIIRPTLAGRREYQSGPEPTWSTNREPVHFTAWLENTDLSIWLRESPSLLAFPFVLIVHAWGMGILAGSNAALDLRIIGFAPRVSLSAMEKFYPVLWFGFTINAISGILLLISYPTKALTNPVFYLKIG